MNEYLEYCQMGGTECCGVEGVSKTTPVQTPVLGSEEMSYLHKRETPKAHLLILRYKGEEIELWFPKAAVFLGELLTVESWFRDNFEDNAEKAIESLYQ